MRIVKALSNFQLSVIQGQKKDWRKRYLVTISTMQLIQFRESQNKFKTRIKNKSCLKKL